MQAVSRPVGQRFELDKERYSGPHPHYLPVLCCLSFHACKTDDSMNFRQEMFSVCSSPDPQTQNRFGV